ncbi:transpeptidase family protein [bacterium]|jgi:cell division protein FtsI (penicillin-binding protein 3)|nr:transpeptidase family protein [bacterium]MDC0854248.1 penicillin-binding protein [Flavobacteriales bacterium]
MKNRKEFSMRAWLVFGLFVALGFSIFGRILWIQSAEHEQWKEVGERFESSVRDINPSRGQIYAINGNVLATSVPVFEVRWDSKSEAINWDTFDAELDSLSQGLSQILGDRSPREYREVLRNGRNLGRRNTLIARRASYIQQKRLAQLPFIRRGRFKSGFTFARTEQRRKPFGDLASRTIGIDRNENRVGLEASWNTELSGSVGKQIQRRVAGGEWMPVSDDFIVEPQAGLDVISSIDMHLQDVASNALRQQLQTHDAAWGTVILMEVETGMIRAMANLTRSTSEPQEGEPADYFESFNHAIGTAVEPGSTFKLASLMAAMNDGNVKPEDEIDTGNGVTYFYGKRMSDSNADEGGSGILKTSEIFEVSSNVGTALTIKNAFGENQQGFLDALERIGVQSATGVRLAGESQPLVYENVGDGRWSGLSLTQMSIGYEVTQTPLQTLTLYNAVANGGTSLRPQLVERLENNGQVVKTFKPEVLKQSICSSRVLEACQSMLKRVADPEGNGTAQYIFAKSPYRVAGKTGTARIAGPNGYDGRYRASFAGYFPAESPRYSCIVVIADTKSGVYYGSSIAGPVFRELANKVYATDPSFHTTSAGLLAEKCKLPGSKDGAQTDLMQLYQALEMPYLGGSSGDWVTVTTGDSVAVLSPRFIEANRVPDVRGMGLRDALYLLENAGLQVKTLGMGTVRRQSIAPGSDLTTSQAITLELS